MYAVLIEPQYYGPKSAGIVPLARLDKIKDIGVYFDAKLDFKNHMHEKNKQGMYDVSLN